jgi:hypothetical protein
MATTNGINYNQTRGVLISTNGKNRVIVSTGGTTTFTGDTNASTVVSVSGTNGGLFSVVDTNTGTLLEVLDNANNPIFQVGTVDKIKISGLTSASDTNVLTIDSSGVVHTSSFINGSGTPNEITYFSASGTVASLPVATYPSLTELSYVKGATSSIQTQLNTKISNNINILGYQALGSTIKGATLDLSLNRTLTTVSHATTGRMQITPIYIPVATTITGVKFVSATQGSFTASNYNGIGLYSYNTATGAATLLTATANDDTIWKQTANTVVSKAFTGATSVAAGLYFIGSVVNSSAGTGPSILGTVSLLAPMATYDFTNSARLVTHIVSQTTLPSTWNMSSGIANPIIFWFSLY